MLTNLPIACPEVSDLSPTSAQVLLRRLRALELKVWRSLRNTAEEPECRFLITLSAPGKQNGVVTGNSVPKDTRGESLGGQRKCNFLLLLLQVCYHSNTDSPL